MAFVNLGQIIYPVGSIYISVTSTSPATIFGGTWTAINGDACLMACTSSIGSYSGTKKISINQMPSHKHAIGIGDDSDGNVQNIWALLGKSPNYSVPGNPDALHKIVQQQGRTGFQVSECMVNTGGGKITCRTTSELICGKELLNLLLGGE